jgi:uroporphyrinogen decarboxylase
MNTNVKKNRFQNALANIPQATPPIWFMRQAGRYHKHYQNLRRDHSFMELCKSPELAAKVALGPIEDFDFDAAILFSDILFPLEALGMGLEYTDHGPKLGWQLNEETLKNLKNPEEALKGLDFQRLALLATRDKLSSDKSLIGFIGAPWTLFTYAVQGKHDGSLIKAKQKLDLFPAFCEILIPLLYENIKLQLAGGAEIIMLFDTAAGELSPGLFHEFVVPQLFKLQEKYKGKLAYYAKGTGLSHVDGELFENSSFIGLGFDHRWNLPEILSQKKFSGFTQGNFDQALLFSEPRDFQKRLLKYLEPFTKLSLVERAPWVCGLGHGVLPETPEINVRTFIKTVREVFK